MFRPVNHLLYVLFATIVLLPILSLTAQEQVATDDQNVTRVIKLRSNDPPAPPEPKATPQRSSRSERLAQRPTNLPDPTQIQFDEITTQPKSVMSHEISQKRAATQPFSKGPVVDNQFNQFVPAQNMKANSVKPRSVDAINEPSVITTMAPQIATKILAPKQINVKESADITIQIQNVSRQMANDVKLIATLPSHAQFVSARPQPTRTEGQTFEFTIHQINARQTQEIQINLTPTEKRPIEIGTQIHIVETQTIAVGVRQPEIRVTINGPERANTGQWIEHIVVVENTGDGIAENIILDRQHPEQLQLEKGKRELIVPRLVPGEKMTIPVKTFCQSAGQFELGFELAGKNLETQTSVRPLTVLQPELQISAAGPNMTFVNRDGIYAIQIQNTGQVDVTNVKLDFQVPSGFEVTTVSRQTEVDPNTGSLLWSYDRIAANTEETIQLKATTKTPGTQVCMLAIGSDETQTEQIELVTEVATRADVSINISNAGGPVEVGGKTEFVISVTNKGSSTATGVEVQVELAAALMPVQLENYVLNEMDNSVRFSAINIEPGETQELQFSAVGVSKGEHVVRGVVTTSGSERRLITEDSVYVFESDQSKVSESVEPTIHRK